VLVSPRRTAIVVIASSLARAAGSWSEARYGLWSQFADGTFLATSGGRLLFHPVEATRVFRQRGANPVELLVLHERHLAEVDLPPLPVGNAAQAEQLLLAVKRRNFEGKVRRGIWVPLTRQELEQLGLPVDE
jgi:hypothetical protein